MNVYQEEQLTQLLEARPIMPEMVADFFGSIKHHWRMQDKVAAYKFLREYADRIESEHPDVANSIRDGYKFSFENKVREGAKENLRQIVSIPHDTKIDPKFLNELSNEDFVTAFEALQEFLIACYSDIARAPFEWGYPCAHQKLTVVEYGEYRLRNMLSSLFAHSEFDRYTLSLSVDRKAFLKSVYKSSTKETELMLEGFTNMGLIVENFDSKSKTFNVSFPDNVDVLRILPLFFSPGECRRCWEDCSHMGRCYWNYPITRNTSFSYRFFEDRAMQTYETEFLIALDGMPENLREIHFWLYEEAKKYGFDFDRLEATAYGCILYRRGGWGGKNMPLVGVYDISGDRMEGNKVVASTTFKRIFETHPEEVAKLMERFPDAIGNRAYDCSLYCGKAAEKICKKGYQYQIDGVDYRSCGYKSFMFIEPTFEDVKMIVALWKLENRIK